MNTIVVVSLFVVAVVAPVLAGVLQTVLHGVASVLAKSMMAKRFDSMETTFYESIGRRFESFWARH